ncbi:FCD domain-containing protein [Conexibacter sp. JD483]|uniref:FadR/GntR family transcriptional regulator n=1 Tax=unclassified Conexibacter TaxID=2627773 RepID=UPI002725C72F|nr:MULTISPECIES: FCD domain-containing protein [unclassified Conexibacter]MDO8189592.1 FCD domain-containing protein [Conexibacter sp. CPCC 205706]MDO8201981.1 FCD domain-containing protein [Conexibacter sp. CPCC 205762]MDR9373111.1 FCD domain-containing protein [Conexibacter sp. JD483]
MSGGSLAASVARQLGDEIVAAGWPVGAVLGSERELIERMGVSRGVLREAVRIVEHHGIARMRRGPGGGLVVSAPQLDAVADAISLFLQYEGARRSQLFSLRVTLELAAVAQAAERIDEVAAARLRACVAAERRRGYGDSLASARPHTLHVLIAELTGNPAMRLFARVLADLTSDRDDVLVEPRRAAVYGAAHHGIAEALVAGDGALAQLRMRRHLEAVAPVFADDEPAAPVAPAVRRLSRPA